jgi:UDP-N-acetylmuramate: L-alanyl-gamma-D-glutamyl-meso-diaminopimelate ligase
LIINNLEFDHADIFADLADIQRQFHHLVRTVPGNGLIIAAAGDPGIDTVLETGCWSALERLCVGDGCQALWQAVQLDADAAGFELVLDGKTQGRLRLPFAGLHNIHNTLAAIAAARHAGVPVGVAVDALLTFKGVRRRMQLRGEVDGIRVYDDFAHHPTAINLTLQAARSQLDGTGRIIAVLEPRSNTMRMGIHRDSLAGSLAPADVVFLYQPSELSWSLQDVADQVGGEAMVYDDVDTLVSALSVQARSGDRIIVMSNGAFGGIHEKLLSALSRKPQTA